VRDDGPGIEPERLADAAAQGRLGVAQWIKGPIADLGGAVRVTCSPGEGARWSSACRDLDIVNAVEARVRVMVVDDHPMWREGVCRDLTAAGYEVVAATGEGRQAVRIAAAGDTVFTPGVAGLVLGEFRRLAVEPPPAGDGGAPKLTERETEVLRLVAKGVSYRQIAERLVLSHRTVQNHVQNTLGKLQLHNRVELTRYAIEKGLD
jgi:DNA-binding NarL/FixJ family response regulator